MRCGNSFSLQLYIRVPVKSCSSVAIKKKLENRSTAGRLKPVALAIVVGSGFRTEISECRLRKLSSHFLPAIWFSALKRCWRLFPSANWKARRRTSVHANLKTLTPAQLYEQPICSHNFLWLIIFKTSHMFHASFSHLVFVSNSAFKRALRDWECCGSFSLPVCSMLLSFQFPRCECLLLGILWIT